MYTEMPEDYINGNFLVYSHKYNGYVTDFTLGSESSQLMYDGNSSSYLTTYTKVTNDKDKAYPFLNKEEAEFVASHWNVQGTVIIRL